MRLLLRVAYLGPGFHGFARQPGLRTVQGELEEALRRSECAETQPRLEVSSRTDRGVSALDNVVSVVGSPGSPCRIGRLNYLLPGDVSAWAMGKAPEGVRLRDVCRLKTYVYFIPGPLDPEVFREGLEAALSLGPSRLCRGGGRLEVDDVGVEEVDWGILIRISGERFCWEAVRRIVGAAENYVRMGRPTVSTAPGEGLLLAETKCDAEFEVYPRQISRFLRRWEEEARGWGTGLLLRSSMLRRLTSSRL